VWRVELGGVAVTRPDGLPAELDSFVGRSRELADLAKLIRATRALTLCGPGGVGKTRLALRVLTVAAPWFADGVRFVELGDLREVELVPSRVAAALGVAEEPGRPLTQTLVAALERRKLIVALDNCEHLTAACAALCTDLLAGSPGLRVLATSREPLGVAAETLWQVRPLPVPPAGAADADTLGCEAVRLFADRAAARLGGFTVDHGNAAVVAGLRRALDGMPLAIELAAALVRVLPPEQISERLTSRFELLTRGYRNATPRHQTLRAAIGWSYDLLSADERVLLRRLSVFAGWSPDMAGLVCSAGYITADRVPGLLAALAGKSLVMTEPDERGQPRHRMLESIREFAAEQLTQAGEASVVQARLADYTLRVAEHNLAVGMARIPAPWSARVDVFRRYDADADNVRHVLDWCRAGGDPRTGLRICAAVSPCWIARGALAEGTRWLDAFLSMDQRGVPPLVRGAALVAQAQLTLPADVAGAERKAREGLELCQDTDGFWAASALNLLAQAALHAARLGEAAALASQALSAAEGAADDWNRGYALGTQAAIAARHGDLERARCLGGASVNVMDGIDHQWGAARGMLGLGDLARCRGDLDGARAWYRRALPILCDIGASPEIARGLAGLGRVSIGQGAVLQARRHLTDSIRLSRETGSRIAIARCLEAFAALALREDRPELAVQLTAAAAATREPPRLGAAHSQVYLTAAARIGTSAAGQLWAKGIAISSEEAIALAVGTSMGGTAPAALPADGSPGILTPRERQVAALIASGHTNKSIATELIISPATAACHVARILAKLGFTSRTQVATWAAQITQPHSQTRRPQASGA
jgi:predicted ATPase/DNA-binding NarL/FixJ family response regulator